MVRREWCQYSTAQVHQEHINVGKAVVLITLSKREHTPGDPGGGSLTGRQRGTVIKSGLWLGDSGQRLRKWGCTVGWTLSEGGYLHGLPVGRADRAEIKLVIGQTAAVIHFWEM